MHRIPVFCLLIWFSIFSGGCLISPEVIKTDMLAYGEVIEDTTNKLLVTNLLRARDKAPLHFADIPIIRESMQQSFNFSWTALIGPASPRSTPTGRDSTTFGTSAQKTPSFDISHLHSKDFITGISSPIDPKVVKYWLDRGLDRRIALLLFFSAVEIVETQSQKGPVRTIRVTNSPREAVEVIKRRTQAFGGDEALRCDTQSDFERYLKLFNTLKTFFAANYRERRLLARGVRPGDAQDSKNLQAFAALDQSKVQLSYDRVQGTYSLYALSNEQKVAFCFYDDTQATGRSAQFETIEAGAAVADRRSCSQSIVDIGADESPLGRRGSSPIFFPGAAAVSEASPYCSIYNRFTRSGPLPPLTPTGYPRLELRLYIRSVGEIFQFLGDLLHYQEEIKRHFEENPQLPMRLNTPVTFGYCGDHPEIGCDDIFLRLDGDPCNARFSLNYRERVYHVSNFDPDSRCGSTSTGRKDHTLEVLGVLHQLIGLNKSASDIRSTPAVQLLP